MKTTKYFASGFKPRSQLNGVIIEVEKKRDDFMVANELNIEEIEAENIQFIDGTSGDYVAAIITLTYYIKENDIKGS